MTLRAIVDKGNVFFFTEPDTGKVTPYQELLDFIGKYLNRGFLGQKNGQGF